MTDPENAILIRGLMIGNEQTAGKQVSVQVTCSSRFPVSEERPVAKQCVQGGEWWRHWVLELKD